ncbi:HAD hydrolase family protein [Clostridium gelidum]|uniref:HAD hydrolase family protein n=1 Tax=Clostridium gelidum TaxID=704125 RepID=UPI001CC7F1BA|nr:HAD hydrolase family protein [Clostridium gelidum]
MKYLRVALEDVIAFGYDYNDIEMIKYCGLGIAMENAIPQVEKVANVITVLNDADGVAKYIEEYIRFR